MSLRDPHSLRSLLQETQSADRMAMALAAGELSHLVQDGEPAHLAAVVRRLERAAPDVARLWLLKLTALVHHERQGDLYDILEAAGFAVDAKRVADVLLGFGRLEALPADEVGQFVAMNRPHISELLMFELAHEGRPAQHVADAARAAGLEPELEAWAERLR